jgi:hypothetical protein
MMEQFLVGLKTKKGERPGIQTLRGYRSAVFSMFKDQKVVFPEQFDQHLNPFFKGLRRLDAERKAAGDQDVFEGKNLRASNFIIG